MKYVLKRDKETGIKNLASHRIPQNAEMIGSFYRSISFTLTVHTWKSGLSYKCFIALIPGDSTFERPELKEDICSGI